ncbi:MAG: gliding motility-associated C-terminal domain-containing protein [Bacteroidales bacterium]
MQGETLELDAGEGYDAYTLWQDGSGGQYFLITEQNMDTENPYYYVEVKQGMCLNSDTVKVELFEVWVPIVITPNGDGWNDVFEPDMNSWNGIQKHSMEVFSRWGERYGSPMIFLRDGMANRTAGTFQKGPIIGYWKFITALR